MKLLPRWLGIIFLSFSMLTCCQANVPGPAPGATIDADQTVTVETTVTAVHPIKPTPTDAVRPSPTPTPPAFWYGVDASFLPQVEASGAQFYADGIAQDALAIFAAHGVNSVRLRVWVNPADGHSGATETLAMARRIHALDMALLLNLHYSDTWADPGHQRKPAAWAELDFVELETAVYTHAFTLITALKTQGTLPHMVQIGNEISPGFLWDDGRVGAGYEANWPQLAALLQAGIAGVQDALAPSDRVQIMLHLDAGANNAVCRWFLDNLQAQGVAFDVLGLTYYPWWQGSLEALAANLQDLSQRYPQELVLVETAYPWTLDWQDDTHNLVGLAEQLLPGYPATPAGQAAFLHDVLATVQAAPQGRGVYYWAPEAVAVPGFGSFWENVALFDFNGQALPALAVLAERP
jgi:arabinogalactan endo-1,4-beta-galactosidase